MSLLEMSHVTLGLTVDGIGRTLLDDVTVSVDRREIVGLVGESGSGKSTAARAAIGILPAGARLSGKIAVEGTDALGGSPAELRRLRAETVGMVFQDPRSSVNPVWPLGTFLTESLRVNLHLSREESTTRVLDALNSVGLRDPEQLLSRYPGELSGGMLQRVVIAAALAAEPHLIIADEATSALDVTTQADVLAVLRQAQRERGLGMLFITHDLHLAAAFCDRVLVMYRGRIVEEQEGAALFEHAKHPYTRALLAAVPGIRTPHEHPEGGAPA